MVTKLVKKETEGKEAERMEKENRQRRKRNKKDIRNAFVMLCVTIAMMSTATFAWFTMTDSPTVQGLKMTAAATGGLELSVDKNDWNSVITVDSDTKSLSPVSTFTNTKVDFGTPVYADGSVGSITKITDETELKKSVAVYTYYIRASLENGGSVDVGLLGGDGSSTGTYIIRDTANSASEGAANAIRVGFLIDSTDWFIYEPQSDRHASSSSHKAGNTYTGQESTVQQTATGTFVKGGTGEKTNKLFTLSDVNAHTIKMYVWLEGTDDDCVNEIQTDLLKGQIQFTVIK